MFHTTKYAIILYENNRKQGGCLLFPIGTKGVMLMNLYEALCLLIRAGEFLLALLAYFRKTK